TVSDLEQRGLRQQDSRKRFRTEQGEVRRIESLAEHDRRAAGKGAVRQELVAERLADSQDHPVRVADEIPVEARTSVQIVRTLSAGDQVVANATDQQIVAATAGELVVTCTAV